MAAVTLNANDAAELAEMLQFLADWLNRDPSRLGASLEDFVGHPAYNTCQLREDLDRSRPHRPDTGIPDPRAVRGLRASTT